MGRKKHEALNGLAELGDQLRSIRLKADLSQMRVSELMGFNPTHGYKYILKLEKGTVPNPTLRTVISYRVPGSSANQHVKLTVLNVRGQVVKTLVDGVTGVGTHTVAWEWMDSSGRQVATCIYLFRLEVGRSVG